MEAEEEKCILQQFQDFNYTRFTSFYLENALLVVFMYMRDRTKFMFSGLLGPWPVHTAALGEQMEFAFESLTTMLTDFVIPSLAVHKFHLL